MGGPHQFCEKGHPLTAENRAVSKSGRSLGCRICRHRPLANHIWVDNRCTVCRIFKMGTYERWVDDFWAKVDKNGPNGCWLWTGAVAENGYGHYGRKGKAHRAHRIAYSFAHGLRLWEKNDQKMELVIMHSCDNKLCVNPAHMNYTTQRENMIDKERKGRGRYGYIRTTSRG